VNGKFSDDGLSRTRGGGNQDALPLFDPLARFDLKRIQIEIARNTKLLDDRVRGSNT
jgi:hypothetical protein